jgi:hypothetical protein
MGGSKGERGHLLLRRKKQKKKTSLEEDPERRLDLRRHERQNGAVDVLGRRRFAAHEVPVVASGCAHVERRLQQGRRACVGGTECEYLAQKGGHLAPGHEKETFV